MSYFSSYCAEVQDYLRACEHLLAAAQNHQQFSEEELQMVESYAMDVAKLHAPLASTNGHPPSGDVQGNVLGILQPCLQKEGACPSDKA